MHRATCACQIKGPRPTLVDFGDGIKVGLMGMEEAFERCREQGREHSPALGEELLAAIKIQNYVPRSPAEEEKYKTVLLREYGVYWSTRR